MADYTEMADYVKDWSNRDTDVLSYDTIRQCIRYAHDETYRTLRIAPLEVTRSGTVTSAQVNQGYLTIEDDLVEFIQLRKVASEGPRSYSSFDKPYIVAEAHSDARSFNGDTVTLYSDYSFYREGTQIHIFPLIQEGEVWELFYYRRLPEVNERFEIDELLAGTGIDNTDVSIRDITNANPAVITFNSSDARLALFADGNQITITGAKPSGFNTTYEVVDVTNTGGIVTVTTDVDASGFEPIEDASTVRAAWRSNIPLAAFDSYFIQYSTEVVDPDDPNEMIDDVIFDASDLLADSTISSEAVSLEDLGLVLTYPDGTEAADMFAQTDKFVGTLKEQWLRDTNEKVILFGALHQAFDYLDEQDQSEKYKAKFEQEIAKLNKEEMDRMNSGGNINVNFYNRLI